MAELVTYERLEYLESDGYQYIDTGLSAPADTSLYFKLSVLDINSTWGVIGTRSTTKAGAGSYNIFVVDGKLRLDLRGTSGSSLPVSVGVPFEIDYTPSATVFDGTRYANAVTKTDCNYSFFLFNFNNAGDAYALQGAPQRLYGFKMYHGEALVADYVPARIGGKCCMYDKVSNTFKYNEGTGEFAAGPMLYLVKNWENGDELNVTYDGEPEGQADFASVQNEGIDREMSVSFVNSNRSVFVERTVRQEGMREVFMASEGDFLLADGGTFNVLKAPKYQQVEYIESVNADAYIDTGFMPNNRTRLVVDYHGEDSSDVAVYVFGVGVRNTSQLFSLKVSTSSAKYTLDWAKTSTATSASIGERHVIDLNKNVITIGTVSNTVTDVEFQCTSNLRLLSGTNTSGAERFSNGIIYSCLIYDDGVLVRDYIPVIYEGKAGLWDKLADKFYPSAGSGEFVAGDYL